ncbi:MAG TPA: RES family NAD+ phosphorylase [Thermoanaerobaculia bacterium]|nr:RES family NAD+ phosphorylase [Thermoanaerobaculia bacterium]
MTLPSPPADLPPRPRLYKLAQGDLLVRFYNPAHGGWDALRTYGPLHELRFDHHLPPPGSSTNRSVWYAATSVLGAVAEAFGNNGFIDRGSGRRICLVRVREPIVVLDLAGAAPRAFGLDQRIATSRDYTSCQAWARAFYEGYPGIFGLRWRGRQAGAVCFALNDRTDMGSLEALVDRDVGDPEVWPRIVRAARRCRIRILAP